jgi:prepilin-type N-terminal cleavage/methylation domain-containing protein
MTRAPVRRARRKAFTLVELLVVIAIIAVLVSLTAAAIFRTLGVQQTANSKTALTRMQSRLDEQWSAAAARFYKETLPPADATLKGVYYNVVVPMAGGDPQRARVIWVKLRLKQEFPNTFNEALNPAPMPPLTNYVSYLNQLGYTTANTSATAPQAFESSACLLMALTRGEGGNTTKAEDLGVNGGNLKDYPAAAPGQTVKAVTDGWGNPLAFCRWPTGSPQLNPTGPQPGAANDPGDGTGLLTKATWLNTPGQGDLFQQYAHALAQPDPNTGEPRTYRLGPLVAGPGADGKLGLDPLTFTPLSADANDDLYPTLSAHP